MKYLVFLISFLPSICMAEKICSAKYTYEENVSSSLSTDYSWMEDYSVYKSCKKFCEENNRNNARNVECDLAGEDIEKSKYKTVYQENKSKLCTLTMKREKDGRVMKRVSLKNSAEECTSEVQNAIECRSGESNCSTEYGI